jgi:DNA polymerase elongation subunit (family B)
VIAEHLGEVLTKICQEEVQSKAMVVEPEMIMDRFYIPRRNKYAGRIVWQPGTGATPFDIATKPVDARIKMQGLAAKATNTAKIGKTVQFDSIKMIWDEAEPLAVLSHLQTIVDDVRNGVTPVEDLVARASLGQWLPSSNENGHYDAAATNESARADAKDGSDKCYANLSGDKKGAAWHNIVLANDVYLKLDKGDSYNFIFVKDGPTWIPEGGYVAFHDLSQIEDYTIDIDTIIEKNIISKLDHILYGIGLSNSMLREGSKFQGRELTLEDFQ